MRLGRYHWHRRLFDIWEECNITDSEIRSLTTWWGTLAEKKKFQETHDHIIEDTTGKYIEAWVEPEKGTNRPYVRTADITPDQAIFREADLRAHPLFGLPDEDSDADLESVGVALNERLRAAAAQRDAGNNTITMDPAWEEWLKAQETDSDLTLRLSGPNFPSTMILSGSVLPATYLNHGRLGQWHEIPRYLHNSVRHALGQSPVEMFPSLRQAVQATASPLPDRLRAMSELTALQRAEAMASIERSFSSIRRSLTTVGRASTIGTPHYTQSELTREM